MYDKDGNWQKQKVHLGITQSGQHGFFTGHTLAWPLTASEFMLYSLDLDLAANYAASLDFQFI